MFIIAKAIPVKKPNILGRLFGKQTAGLTFNETRINDIFFYTANCRYIKGGLPFEELKKLIPRFNGRVVFPKDYEIPDDEKPLQCASNTLAKRAAAEIACEICDALPLPLIKRSAAVWDTAGAYQEAARKLIMHVPLVTVYTKNPRRYDETAAQILEEYGAPVIVTESLDAAAKSDVILTAESRLPTFNGITVYADNQKHGERGAVSLKSFALPKGLKQCIPEFVDSFDFISAATAWGAKSPKFKAENLYAEGKEISRFALKDYIYEFYSARIENN